MTLANYITRKRKLLHGRKYQLLQDILSKSITKSKIYCIQGHASQFTTYKKVEDNELIEYNNFYKFLYPSISYYLWYKNNFQLQTQKSCTIKPGKRRTIIDRDKCCIFCNTEENLTVDHIIPYSKSKNSSIYNLMTLCKTCNNNKKDSIPSSNFIIDILIPHIKMFNPNYHLNPL